MRILENWKQSARRLKMETFAIYLAYRDPRTPWYARLFAILVVAYAFSPIDLIPDPIPVLGYLDDLVLVPLGIALTIKMIPPHVLTDCRARAAEADRSDSPGCRAAAAVVVAIWLILAAVALSLLWRAF
jgi:uncharacterized membrane protein YkvA (DUF1232 family)